MLLLCHCDQSLLDVVAAYKQLGVAGQHLLVHWVPYLMDFVLGVFLGHFREPLHLLVPCIPDFAQCTQGQVHANTRVAFGQELPTLPMTNSTFIMTYLIYRAAANTVKSAFRAKSSLKVCQDSARVVTPVCHEHAGTM